jgi:hypothetical protein
MWFLFDYYGEIVLLFVELFVSLVLSHQIYAYILSSVTTTRIWFCLYVLLGLLLVFIAAGTCCHCCGSGAKVFRFLILVFFPVQWFYRSCISVSPLSPDLSPSSVPAYASPVVSRSCGTDPTTEPSFSLSVLVPMLGIWFPTSALVPKCFSFFSHSRFAHTNFPLATPKCFTLQLWNFWSRRQIRFQPWPGFLRAPILCCRRSQLSPGSRALRSIFPLWFCSPVFRSAPGLRFLRARHFWFLVLVDSTRLSVLIFGSGLHFRFRCRRLVRVSRSGAQPVSSERGFGFLSSAPPEYVCRSCFSCRLFDATSMASQARSSFQLLAGVFRSSIRFGLAIWFVQSIQVGCSRFDFHAWVVLRWNVCVGVIC